MGITKIVKEARTEQAELLANFLLMTGYRLVTMEDIQDNAEMLMIDIGKVWFLERNTSPLIWGTRIRLDSPCIAGTSDPETGGYVYYHCIEPAWDVQCFVPLYEFISGNSEGSPGDEFRMIVPV